MSACPHRRTSGATFFFTIRLADRADDLLTRRIDLLRLAMRATLARHPFHIDAIAVLPGVLHTLWTLPPVDDRWQIRVALLKSRFSHSLSLAAQGMAPPNGHRDKTIWHRDHWAYEIRDAADHARHRALIYLSPVQAGLCARPQDWPHSSLHRDARNAGSPMAEPDQCRGAGWPDRMEHPPVCDLRPLSAPATLPARPRP